MSLVKRVRWESLPSTKIDGLLERIAEEYDSIRLRHPPRQRPCPGSARDSHTPVMPRCQGAAIGGSSAPGQLPLASEPVHDLDLRPHPGHRVE
jgi:hypothetical protein